MEARFFSHCGISVIFWRFTETKGLHYLENKDFYFEIAM